MDSQYIIQEFQAYGRQYDVEIPGDIEFGKIIRFSDGDDKRNKNAWAVLHSNENGSAGGAFGNWRTGEKHNKYFPPAGGSLSNSEKRAFSKKIKEDCAKAENEKYRTYENKANTAQKIWHDAREADPEHPYLKKKRIPASGLKQSGNNLMAPLQNDNGLIYSLQFIDLQGRKKFLPGGKVKGCFATLGDFSASSSICVCEGFATGATLFMALENNVVVVAFNSGNLVEVCLILKSRFPEKQIIVASDNDIKTKEKIGKNPGVDAAFGAAELVGANVCVCPVDSDFNDLFCGYEDFGAGLEAVRGAFAVQQICPLWDSPPIPFDASKLPIIDLGCFPGVVREMIDGVANATETPPELSVTMAMAVIATACHGKIKIRVKDGWSEPLCLFVMSALEPANRKSAVLSKMTKPISDYEKESAAALSSQIEIAKSKRKLQEARLKHLRNQYARAKQRDIPQIEAEILNIEQNLIQIPSPERLYCQDITAEKLAVLMAENSERMSNYSSEGGIIDTMAGRYSNMPNIDLYLQAYSGDFHKVDRTGRESIVLDQPCLTIGIVPQPTVLISLIANSEFRRRGLPARFLYFLPESPLGYRTYATKPVSRRVEKEYHELIMSLLKICPAKDNNGHEIPYVLKLTAEAATQHFEFCHSIERELRPGGNYEDLKDWAGKLAGNTARIAALLHCAKNPDSPWKKTVDDKTMADAIDVAMCFAAHAQKIFKSAEVDPNIEMAQKILNWIKHNRFQIFSRRDCFEKFKGRLKTVDKLEPILNLLVENNYIRRASQTSKPGRKSVKYDVNPQILTVQVDGGYRCED